MSTQRFVSKGAFVADSRLAAAMRAVVEPLDRVGGSRLPVSAHPGDSGPATLRRRAGDHRRRPATLRRSRSASRARRSWRPRAGGPCGVCAATPESSGPAVRPWSGRAPPAASRRRSASAALSMPGAGTHAAVPLACLVELLAGRQRVHEGVIGQSVYEPGPALDPDQRLTFGLPGAWPGPALARLVDACQHCAEGVVLHPRSLCGGVHNRPRNSPSLSPEKVAQSPPYSDSYTV